MRDQGAVDAAILHNRSDRAWNALFSDLSDADREFLWSIAQALRSVSRRELRPVNG